MRPLGQAEAARMSRLTDKYKGVIMARPHCLALHEGIIWKGRFDFIKMIFRAVL